MDLLSLFHVGTSGWSYPEWQRKFYPSDIKSAEKLGYYSSVFDCLEVNSTFYRMHRPSTFNKWADTVPSDFRFTFKMWREVTHAKNFAGDERFIAEFMAAIDNIGNKRGPILVQVPPRLTAKNINGLERILTAMHVADPHKTWPVAVELRNPLWYTDEVYALLDEHGASLVLHDMPHSGIMVPNDKAPFIYLRFHGVKGDYRGGYSDEFLQGIAQKAVVWLRQGKQVYAYFNNTMDGDAPYNAQTLRRCIKDILIAT